MTATSIELSGPSNQALQDLADRTGQTKTQLVDRAIADLRRKVFFEQLDAGYAAINADADDSSALRSEREAWDGTLMDGLDAEERWSEDGRCLTP